jgi:hypothetical protein
MGQTGRMATSSCLVTSSGIPGTNSHLLKRAALIGRRPFGKQGLQDCKDNRDVIDYIKRMGTYDRELSAKMQKLESIEARLAQHEKTTRYSVIWLTALASVILAMLMYHLVRL